jgi:UDP-4-amino-4-deoxy-L-arabinose-oxoglutarate aminotransferase
MSDIQAALLIKQLPRLAAQLDRREAIARRYEEAFADMPGIQFPRVPRTARSARHLFTIWVPPEHRDETVWQLQEDGIGVAVNYRAVHLLTYYRERYGFSRGAFPIAERIGDSTITLPLYPKMLDEDVEAVVAAVRRVAAKWSRS